ncbi:Dabb family protein [Opitutus sp. GAS368]|uniref:Dabb family protein n=1 Tax=Opitutus sp. GAS368 TaxID=1882749 RepID=UPI00087C048B|nr:Dabb family protein [Opitutus sp. GAS368]SDR99258.1 Stress responsive A/B Barrel Domain [Opitutus sp. GAS368]
MLFHNVYFWLKPELTPARRVEFRRGVETLTGIKSVMKVTVGAPAKTGPRPVIDHSYDVALIVQCRDVAAHDAYQADPIHLAFIAKFKSSWTRVQIYDSE